MFAPMCAAPNRPAIATYEAPARFPDGLRHGGTTKIRVTIDATGKALRETVLESSGYAALDRAALKAAKRSEYSPRLAGCKPVAGNYLFVVTFSPGA